MRTAGQFLQDTPFIDGQIFLGIGNFSFNSAVPAVASSGDGSGLYFYSLTTASNTSNCFMTLNNLFRTGTLPNYQEQFGTAALQPGPSSVAGTSDPLALVGMPPTKQTSLATLKGGISGFVPKGVQVNWIDVIYSTGANAISTAKIGLTTVQYKNNIAPSVTQLIAFGANGLPTAAQVNPYVTRVLVPTPSFTVLTDTQINLQFQINTLATATVAFYGLVFGVSFNFN